MSERGTSSKKWSEGPWVLHLAMAFGQGIGTMLATDEAVETALEGLQRRLPGPDIWKAHALKFVEYARAVGAIAAAKAASEGSYLIQKPHVEAALKGIAERIKQPSPLDICNC